MLVMTVLQSVPSTAQSGLSGFFASWEDRARDTLASQPYWPTPLVTASSGLLQLFRTDFARQISPTGTDTWNYGNTKGFDLVPWYKVEVDVLIPPYIEHNIPSAKDGFGDFSMLLKYRLAGADQDHGNYAVSVSLATTLPTGSFKNGSLTASVSPTVCAGKGFGRFDVQSTLGATLPTSDTLQQGRVVVWNTAAQFRIGKLFWPEVEDNASFFHGGPRDGMVQNFVTPGLVVSKFKLERDPRNRLAVMFGAGMQIATSQFHTYNHGLALTARMLF
jgi:hypothetical protein